MDSRISPKGGFASASALNIKIPHFINYRIEDDQFSMDIVWHDVPLTSSDYAMHMEENIYRPLRQSTGEKIIFPYFFQHIPYLPNGTYLSVTESQLDVWKEMVPNHEVNKANALLIQSIYDAKLQIEAKEAEFISMLRPAEKIEFDPAI